MSDMSWQSMCFINFLHFIVALFKVPVMSWEDKLQKVLSLSQFLAVAFYIVFHINHQIHLLP